MTPRALILTINISLAHIIACGSILAAEPPPAPLDPSAIAAEPMRYLENDRLKLGIHLGAGGAITYLEDKRRKSPNMVNSFDWGRQIQLSLYSGPKPYIGPNGEIPDPTWAGLGWNPVQAGSVARVPSKTTAFERGADFMRVRCIPMQFSHANIPADCDFEATYRLLGDNVVEMRGRIINRRTDKTQYPACNQEMPALYTNGPWYRLITHLGDAPHTLASLTTIAGKDDVKGWPNTAWAKWHATEHWAALVDEAGWGVGLYQPDTCSFGGGFAGGNEHKGKSGPQDGHTGYLTAGAMRILIHNIDHAYSTHIVVGTLEEIRAHASKQPRQPLAWKFTTERLGWIYENATDAGWPIQNGLKITHKAAPRGAMLSDVLHWQATDAPILEIEAAFTSATPTTQVDVEIQPFASADRTDFPAWEVASPAIIEETARKQKAFPTIIPIVIPLTVPGDGQVRTHTLKLADNPAYRGAMKQLRLSFSATDGTVEVRRIDLRR